MKLKWHDFMADPAKYPQPDDRTIHMGAKGGMYTFGIVQYPGRKDFVLTLSLGPIGVREILQPDISNAQRAAQKIEDGRYHR